LEEAKTDTPENKPKDFNNELTEEQKMDLKLNQDYDSDEEFDYIEEMEF
jgi:hypothetical protein